MPTARRWRLGSGHAPARMATQAMETCARVRLGSPTWMYVRLRAHRGRAPERLNGGATSGLILVSLPPEANGCLIHHGGCHVHAECIPIGPEQVSTTGLDIGALPIPPPPPHPTPTPTTKARPGRAAPSVQGTGPLSRLSSPTDQDLCRSPAAAVRVTVATASGSVRSWTPVPRSGPQPHPIPQGEGTEAGTSPPCPRRALRASEGYKLKSD